MRCYLIRKGHIVAVEFLTPGSDDALVEQAKAIFAGAPDDSFDSFEVWDGARRLHADVEETRKPSVQGSADSSSTLARRVMPSRRSW